MDEDTAYAYLDAWGSLLGAILVIAVVAILLMAPVAQNNNKTADPFGDVQIEATWDPASDADVDLWVAGPDGIPIGYSNKNGTDFDLLRDDLGHDNDPGLANLEQAVSRTTQDGKYVVNLHGYASAEQFPVDVVVVVKVKKAGKPEVVFSKRVTLHYAEQLTVVRFEVVGRQFQPGSVNNIPIDVRTAK